MGCLISPTLFYKKIVLFVVPFIIHNSKFNIHNSKENPILLLETLFLLSTSSDSAVIKAL